MSRRSRELDLLPSNALGAERALSRSTGFGDDILPEDIRKLWNAREAASHFLSFMAWGLHVDFWEDDFPEPLKRSLIEGSFAWHRKKGTPWVIQSALKRLGFWRVKIPEWPELRSPAHTFAVEVWPFTEDIMRCAIAVIYEFKPLRSHLLWLAGGLAFLEEAEPEESVTLAYALPFVERHPWPGMYYGGPLLYSALPTYGGPIAYGEVNLDYGGVYKNTPCYGMFEVPDTLSASLVATPREAVFAAHSYGDGGLTYDEKHSYGSDASVNDLGPRLRYALTQRERLEPEEHHHVRHVHPLADRADVLGKRIGALRHAFGETIETGEKTKTSTTRSPVYNGKVQYGKPYGGREVFYT